MGGGGSLFAGGDGSKQLAVPVTEVGPFSEGRWEFDVTSGYLFSPVIATESRPTFNYVQGDFSLGRMLTSPSVPWGMNCMRGNWEGLVNAFGAAVTKGPGSYLAGGRLLLRYNFVQPDARWVPYFQLGGGGLGSDAYRDQNQRIIGGGFEFTLVADLGIRYFINPQCAFMAAWSFEHISNAGTAARNLGVNASGVTLGFGCFF